MSLWNFSSFNINWSQISIKKINIIFNVPPVALENNDLDCMTNLKMYSKDLKHFWIGSCRSVDVTKSAQWRTQLSNPLKNLKINVYKINICKVSQRKKFDLIESFRLKNLNSYLYTSAAAKCPEMYASITGLKCSNFGLSKKLIMDTKTWNTCPEWGVEFPSSVENIANKASKTSCMNFTISSPSYGRK